MNIPMFRVHAKDRETVVLRAHSPKACHEWADVNGVVVTKIKRTKQPKPGEKVFEVAA